MIWGAIALLSVILLVPPWAQIEASGSAGKFAGYAFLLSARARDEAEPCVWRIPPAGGPAFLRRDYVQQRISVSVLLVEALFIALAAGGAVVALWEIKAEEPSKRRSTEEEN